MQYVTIPFDFEKLSPDQKASLVPICIERADRDGTDIAWGWFDAVAAVQDPLRRIAVMRLGDVWRVSELAEGSVRTLWRRHRYDLGRNPGSRVLGQARWYARDLQAGTWQHRRGVVAGLNGLDELLRSRVLTDPARYEDVYQRELYFKDLGEQLVDAGQKDVSAMLNFVRNGNTWPEIGEELGRDPDAARMKFTRWIRRLLDGPVKPAGRRPIS